MFSVPPDFGVPAGFRPCWPKVCEPGDELPDGVPLLPPQAAATSARTARPAAAVKDCVRLRIDIPLLFLPPSSFRGAQEPWARSPRHDGTPNGVRPIMLRPGQEAGNRPGGSHGES